MKRKIKIGLVILILLIIMLVGILQKTKSISLSKEKNLEAYSIYKSLIRSAPPDIKELIALADPETDQKLNLEIDKGLKIEGLKLGAKSLDIQTEIFSFLSPYLNKVKVSDQKSENEYLDEFKNALIPLKLVNLDFSKKDQLSNSGDIFISVLNNLSNIEVPKSLENIHKSEMIVLGSMGYVIKRLAITNDPDEGMALIYILNDLADTQDQIVNKLIK